MTYQSFLKEKGISDEAYNLKDPVEKAALHGEYTKAHVTKLENKLTEMEEKGATKEDVEALKESIDQITTNKEALDNLAEEFAQYKDLLESGDKKKETLAQELKGNLQAIKNIARGLSAGPDAKNKSEEGIIVKALAQRSIITDNDGAFDLPDIGQLATRKIVLMDIFPTITIGDARNDNGVVRYYDWDEATITRAAAMVAEGAVFPESTASFVKRTIEIRKVGDTMPVTEEFFEDEMLFAGELERFLEINVKLQEELQIAIGDDTGQNLRGLRTSISNFTAANFAGEVQDASVYDLIVKMSEEITVAGGAKYSPDVILANKRVINSMKLKKDGENNYIMPPFVTPDGRMVDGMMVIEANVFPDNQIIVGDRRFATIYAKTGYEMSRGMVGNQYIEDEMTLKIRRRLAFLVREADAGGWRRSLDVAADLTTLTP